MPAPRPSSRARPLTVAACGDISICIHHRQTEGLGIDPCQLGNVRCDFASVRTQAHLVSNLANDSLKIDRCTHL